MDKKPSGVKRAAAEAGLTGTAGSARSAPPQRPIMVDLADEDAGQGERSTAGAGDGAAGSTSG